MTAEAIARVVADLRAKRAAWALSPSGLSRRTADGSEDIDPRHFSDWRGYVQSIAAAEAPVVDATALYNANETAGHGGVALYEDHPCIAPPWPQFTIAYARPTGQVRAATFHVVDDPQRAGLRDPHDPERDFADFTAELDANRHDTQPGPWATDNPVDWDRVRWLIDGFLWVGGRSDGRPIVTQGPIFQWKFAVYDDGSPADLHWVQFHPDFGEDDGPVQASHLVALGALNFLNCRNVDIIEPRRPNAERKRIARTGVTVSEINVFGSGRSTRGAGPAPGGSVPLTSVRGHFSHYGACCAHHEPRGLLFGKYTGRVWVPQHARGTEDAGEVTDQTFILRAD